MCRVEWGLLHYFSSHQDYKIQINARIIIQFKISYFKFTSLIIANKLWTTGKFHILQLVIAILFSKFNNRSVGPKKGTVFLNITRYLRSILQRDLVYHKNWPDIMTTTTVPSLKWCLTLPSTFGLLINDFELITYRTEMKQITKYYSFKILLNMEIML